MNSDRNADSNRGRGQRRTAADCRARDLVLPRWSPRLSAAAQDYGSEGRPVSLEIVPVTFREAKAFITRHHRHHRPPRGMKFCLGIENDGELVGVATVGRPVGRHLDDGRTLEVNRTATDGTRNVNSMLYGAAWRAAKAMGYRRLITYTQEGESGASLRAAGYRVVAELAPRGSWAGSSVKLRHLRDAEGTGGVQRSLWEAAG